MKSDVIIRTVLAFANDKLVPEKYKLLSAIVEDLIIGGLHDVLEEKISINGFDIKFIDDKN